MDLLHTVTGVNTCNSYIPDLYRLCRIGPADNIGGTKQNCTLYAGDVEWPSGPVRHNYSINTLRF